MKNRSTGAALLRGAVAGAVATWTMDRITTWLYARENQAAREREDNARNGKTAYGVAAEKAASVAGAELSDQQRQRFGTGIHWALGIGAGAVYGMLRNRYSAIGLARGLAFGAAFWLLVDELATPLMGLTPGPAAFPWQTHARGLAGHLAYGMAEDAVVEGLALVT